MGLGLENPLHLALLVLVILLVFGAKRVPEMGRSLGSGMRSFKDALSGEPARAEVATHSAPVIHDQDGASSSVHL
jgi:sec-independent protein translocase protein TatA